MIIDCHCHIFTEHIVKNVARKKEMVRDLRLDVTEGLNRTTPASLEACAETADVDRCILLPTAAPDKITQENDRHILYAAASPRIHTLATLHPFAPNIKSEINRIFDLGVYGFKFSSFSQRFDLDWPETMAMVTLIQKAAAGRNIFPAILLDTFNQADKYFGANPEHITTPEKLSRIARCNPGINIVGAHMGGLKADFRDLFDCLQPAPNLFLDTSNAAHTLTDDQFIRLLEKHGPSQILFGTDWPWFAQESETEIIDGLLALTGFSASEKVRVFGGNALRIFPQLAHVPCPEVEITGCAKT